MTELGGTRAIADRRVYAQDQPPSDNRDGILWVDTSQNPNVTKVYDVTSTSWEPVATGAVDVQDTEPTDVNDGHLWIDTSVAPPRIRVYEANTDSWDAYARKANHDALRNDHDTLRNDHDTLRNDHDNHVANTSNPHDTYYSDVYNPPAVFGTDTGYSNVSLPSWGHVQNKPASTQATEKSGGYTFLTDWYKEGDLNVTWKVGEVLDGYYFYITYNGGTVERSATFTINPGRSDEISFTYNDLTEEGEGGTYEATETWSARYVEEINLDTSYTGGDFDIHTVAVPQHDHTIPS